MAATPDMAKEELDVLQVGGMDVRGLAAGRQGSAWLMNVLYRNGRYETRGGLGLLGHYSSTLNAGRNTALGNGAPVGYRTLLGSTLVVTDQGHEQIVAVHTCRCYTATQQQAVDGTLSNRLGHYLTLISVNVHDLTTGRRTEWVLHSNTQDIGTPTLPGQYPHYLTTDTVDRQSWIQADEQLHTSCSFIQVADVVYLTIPNLGTWRYRPVDPVTLDQRVQNLPNGSTRAFNWKGESSALTQLRMVPGVNRDAYVYLTPSTAPTPTCGAVLENRAVWASGRSLYFSDVDSPSNVIAANSFVMPTDFPITALAVLKGLVLVLTQEETWVYQPSSGAQDGLVSGGRVFNLSRTVGCSDARHIVVADDAVYWMDERGVYTTNGGTLITRLSDAIDPWFSQPEQIQNPITSFQVQAGISPVTGLQPRLRINWTEQLQYGNLCWDSQNRILFCTAKDITLVWKPDAGWTVWLYETNAKLSAGTPVVGLQRGILNPQMVSHGHQVYLVGGIESQQYSRNPYHATDNSFYILQLGRGGGVDRSSAPQEDHRKPAADWVDQQTQGRPNIVPSDNIVLVEEPQAIASGFVTNTQVISGDFLLVPVYLSPSATAVPGEFELRMTFDNTTFEPILRPTGVGEIDALVPPERIASMSGFHLGAGDVNAEVRRYNSGSPSNSGNEVRVHWKGTAGTLNGWTSYPHWSMTPWGKHAIIYLPFRRIAPTTTCSLGITVQYARVDGTPAASLVNGSLPSGDAPLITAADSHAQPVDWAIKTRLVGDGATQVKARGLYITAQSFGESDNKLVPGWVFGLLGAMTASDYRDFAAQAIDYAQPTPGSDDVPDQPALRARLGLSNTPIIQLKTAANVARWGDTQDTLKGNLLISDAAVDTIATSESVRGEMFSSMLMGCIQNPGEQVKVERVRVTTRTVGGRRRTGR